MIRDAQTEARAVALKYGGYEDGTFGYLELKEAIATALAAKHAELAEVRDNLGALLIERSEIIKQQIERAERAESQLAELEKAGAPMANILYNCASHASLPDTTRKSMHEAREEWDNAIRATRRAREAQGGV